MPCSICRQAGHNRSTCGQRINPGINLQRASQQTPIQQIETALDISLRVSQEIVSSLSAADSRRRARLDRALRNLWKRAIQGIINDIRFIKIAKENYAASMQRSDPRVYYPSWLKIKNRFIFRSPMNLAQSIYIRGTPRAIQLVGNIQCIKNACIILYNQRAQRNPIRVEPPKKEMHTIKLVNIKDENYLVYWVLGNYMIQDIDDRENDIRYMGLCVKGSSFPLRTMIGHRFYLVPHRLNTEPPYHPQTDKQFFIEPYLQLNIHDGTGDTIYIDDKDKLSELNKWKFNALKLDFLIREVIKLGGKNNDVLESVLDLHEDIQLSDTSEWLKDIAGIPSTFTNIT
jgi:hypothetical protein